MRKKIAMLTSSILFVDHVKEIIDGPTKRVECRICDVLKIEIQVKVKAICKG